MIPGSLALMLGNADLMLEHDVTPLPRRLQHRQTDFERRQRPAAIVQRRPAVNDRGVEFIDDVGARDLRFRQWLQARFAIAVNHHPRRQGAQVRPVAGYDDDAEVLVPGSVVG